MTDDSLRAAADHRATAQRLREAGDWEGAAMHQRRAITLYRGAADPIALAHALRHLADIHIDAGQSVEAQRPLGEAIQLYTEIDAPPLDVANALRSEAMLLWAAGDEEACLMTWRVVRARYAELDSLIRGMSGDDENDPLAEANAWIARLERMAR